MGCLFSKKPTSGKGEQNRASEMSKKYQDETVNVLHTSGKNNDSQNSGSKKNQSSNKSATTAPNEKRNVAHPSTANSLDINFSSIVNSVLEIDDHQGAAASSSSNAPISLIVCPPPEKLLCGFWIHKRGHVVRTWKKRYCVLDKSDLKYYQQESRDPPYGKNFKGKVALLGAVCIVTPSDDNKQIEVEIYGNHGEKDLFFYVENTEKGSEFTRILQWSIRKVTLSMLMRNLKTSLSKSGKVNERQACTEWIEHHNLLYHASILNLQSTMIYHFINIEENGEMVIRPGLLTLWTAFGEDYKPDLRTEAHHMGIAWKFIGPDELSKYMNTEIGCIDFKPSKQLTSAKAGVSITSVPADDIRIFTFEDIEDITCKYIDIEATKWLAPHMKAFHHTADCEVKRYLLITVHSTFGHNLHILACCLQDYNESILSLKHILLYLQNRTKLSAAGLQTESNKSQNLDNNPSAAAMAIRLLGE